MRDRFGGLWRAVGNTDAAPALDYRTIRRRVNAALDEDTMERRRHMRYKLRLAAVAAAVTALLAGSALAVAGRLGVLEAFFEGDITPAAELVDDTPRSVEDGSYTLTVESSVSDSESALLVVRVDARTEEAAAFLHSDEFNGIDTWGTVPLAPMTGEDGKTTLGYSGGTAVSYGELRGLDTPTSKTWRFTVDLDGRGYTHVRVRLGYMEQGKEIVVPLVPAETLTVALGASGEGVTARDVRAQGQVTLDCVSVTPFTFKMDVTWEMAARHHESPLPILYFRMADGALRTMSQMLDPYSGLSFAFTGGEAEDTVFQGSWSARFRCVQDLSQLAAVVVWGREYPLDGGASHEVQVDAGLAPVSIPRAGSPGVGGVASTIPVRALCEALDIPCVWDNETKTATMTYRGVTVALTWGSGAALVDGKPIRLAAPVFLEDGEGNAYLTPEAAGGRGGALCVEVDPMEQAWQIDLLCPYDSETQEFDPTWTVVP